MSDALRIRAIFAILLPALLVAGCAADTIHFKNGTFIQVDRSQDNGDQVEYWIGSTKYTAAKAEIEKIDKDSGLGIRLGSQGAPNIIVPSEQSFTIYDNVVTRTAAGHFILAYDGDAAPLALEKSLVATLEDQFAKLAQTLQYKPPAKIPVTLYTEREFLDVTQSPSWTGGSDGHLRVPLKDITTMTPALEHVLKNGVGRAFIHSMMGDRCPAWLDQGLAQVLEPRSSSPYALMLANLFQQHKEIPFADLEKPFNGLPPRQMKFATAESLALVQYLNGKYGMDGILRMMKAIQGGTAPEAALRSVTGSGYANLQVQVGATLVKGGAR